MVAFFIPGHTPEQAEKFYSDLPKPTYSPVHPSARLYSIHFRQDGHDCTATVGEDLTGWPDHHGVVMAIIETERLIFVHTLRSLTQGDVIHVDYALCGKASQRCWPAFWRQRWTVVVVRTLPNAVPAR